MGSVNVRNNKLYLDFRFQNQRCREQTALPDTPQNRRQVEKLLARIEAEIVLDQFDYAAYFPKSPMLAKLARLERAQRVYAGTARPLFKEFAAVWMEEKSVEWRYSYRCTVERLVNTRLVPRFGEQEVSDITREEILKFRAELAGTPRKSGKKYSPDHINRHIKMLRMILTEAADRFQFTSPFRGIKPLKRQKTQVDPFSLEEIGQILTHVRPDYRNYYTVRFLTGLRTGEVNGLKWRYVDFERRQILVRETWVMGRTEYTKTDASQREIDMSTQVYEALQAQRQATGRFEYVFCTGDGRPLDHNNVSKRVWYPLLRHLGLRPRSPYQTRHSAASLWLAAGESPAWIARQLGHTTTEMLFRVYARFVPNLTRRDGSAMERLLTGSLGQGQPQVPAPQADWQEAA